MGVLQSSTNLLSDFNHLVPGKPAPALKNLFKSLPLDKFHGVVAHVIKFAYSKQADDIWLIEML